MQLPMLHGSFVDKEDMSNEYKEFRVSKKYITKHRDKFKCFIDNNDMTKIADLMLDSIHSFIIKYITKYIALFVNSSIHEGILHLGIADDGEIIGIPLCKSLVHDNFIVVKTWITTEISKLFNCNAHDDVTELINLIKIDFVDVDFECSDSLAVHTYVANCQRKITDFEQRKISYKNDFAIFDAKMLKCKTAINDAIKDCSIKNDICCYMHSNISDPILFERLKKELYSDIHFDVGQIVKQKDDPSNIAH
jgi:hypothetical protein